MIGLPHDIIEYILMHGVQYRCLVHSSYFRLGKMKKSPQLYKFIIDYAISLGGVIAIHCCIK